MVDHLTKNYQFLKYLNAFTPTNDIRGQYLCYKLYTFLLH